MTRLSLIVLVVALALVPLTALAQNGAIVMLKGNDIPADFEASVTALGGRVTGTHAGAGIAFVEGLSESALASLAANRSVGAALPDFEAQFAPSVPGIEPEAAFVSPDIASAPQTAFFYPRQWHLRAIGADLAWAAGYLGSPDVTVAILDTGISYTHPDLAGRVDLQRSISLVPGDDAIVAAYFPGMHPVTDLHYHGTHVAATVSSNALAAAGVTSNVTLIGVKVLNYQGSGALSAILNGILYATDAGADVINMSLGGYFSKAGNGYYVGMINRVLNYAYQHGTLVVVSAGNESADLDRDRNGYKTYCSAPNVVCVSATGPTNYSLTGPWTDVDAFAGYSNYGRSAISVAAPGGNGSYVYAACSRTSLNIAVCRTGTYVVGSSGTSMASPHVAGVAALIVGQIGHGNPAQVRAILQQSADDLGQPGKDSLYGRGRVNAVRAIGLQ
jgi:lantibiotic leader peptide-processing serine protease